MYSLPWELVLPDLSLLNDGICFIAKIAVNKSKKIDTPYLLPRIKIRKRKLFRKRLYINRKSKNKVPVI